MTSKDHKKYSFISFDIETSKEFDSDSEQWNTWIYSLQYIHKVKNSKGWKEVSSTRGQPLRFFQNFVDYLKAIDYNETAVHSITSS